MNTLDSPKERIAVDGFCLFTTLCECVVLSRITQNVVNDFRDF